MKTRSYISIALLFLSFGSFAQSSTDAFYFSQSFNGGTARFVGMGGAFGALGGDFSSLSYNPAGLGIFRSSEFTFTPSFKNRTINSTFSTNSNEDSRTRLYFDNVGFVFSFKPNKEVETGLVNFNMAFGYNRMNDFYSNSLAAGNNIANSMMDYFAGKAYGTKYYDMTIADDWDPFSELSSNKYDVIMAWNTFLIDTIPGTNGNEYWASLNSGEGVVQKKSTSSMGSSGEYVISMGTNFSNKFYLGATLGITNINLSNSIVYSEDAFTDNAPLPNGDRFNFFDYKQTYETNGSGYNFKIGAIYKPIDGLRLGLAFHTPTYFKLEDTYSYSLNSNFDYGNSDAQTPNSRYDYHLETPFKTIASVAYVINNVGLISFDLEHLDFSSMKFRDGGDGYNYTNENQDINNIFKSVNNIKIGGEVKVENIFLRAGYAFYPNPYKSNTFNESSERSLISGGIGYRSGNFFIDAAYLYSIQKEKYVFYKLINSDETPAISPVSTKMTEGKLLLTLGFKF